MKNQVQLITYADRLGGSLNGIRELLEGPLQGLFGGVHLLPFFDPIDGADAGFDPIDHTSVDEQLGNWRDIAAIAESTEVMADLIVNHISSQSPQFLDYRQRGDESSFSGLFLTYDSVFPQGATEQDLLAIYRPRPALPFTPITMPDGSRRLLWTTFTADQIDINVNNPQGRDYLNRILEIFAANGVSSVRLDAIGYAIKKAGSSCFMLPETFAYIDELAARARGVGLEILVEIHSYYKHQIEIARQVNWVYDFALPPLILHTLFTGSTTALRHWIGIRPVNAVTVLDTHDGIGVIDIGPDAHDRQVNPGLVPDQALDDLVETIHANSGGASRKATGAAAANLDLYQVNCTFYDALGRDNLKYLLARAVQFFLPGIPQVYYVGLLAGCNDLDLLNKTNVGRDINRHYYTRAEIDAALATPVVRQLFELIRLRNSHPAFSGHFEAPDTAATSLTLCWQHQDDFVQLHVNFETLDHSIEFSDGGTVRKLTLTGD